MSKLLEQALYSAVVEYTAQLKILGVSADGIHLEESRGLYGRQFRVLRTHTGGDVAAPGLATVQPLTAPELLAALRAASQTLAFAGSFMITNPDRVLR